MRSVSRFCLTVPRAETFLTVSDNLIVGNLAIGSFNPLQKRKRKLFEDLRRQLSKSSIEAFYLKRVERVEQLIFLFTNCFAQHAATIDP